MTLLARAIASKDQIRHGQPERGLAQAENKTTSNSREDAQRERRAASKLLTHMDKLRPRASDMVTGTTNRPKKDMALWTSVASFG